MKSLKKAAAVIAAILCALTVSAPASYVSPAVRETVSCAAEQAGIKLSAVELKGTVTENISANDYANQASTVKSYLYENSDGTLTRVEYTGDDVIVETVELDGSVTDKKTIECELPVFGGFYAGKNANFLVFGDNNNNDDPEKEVLKVVKYSKGWERQSAFTGKGMNTHVPFRRTSLRMVEVWDYLYIHTGHSMFKDEYDLNHQATWFMKLDTSTMSIVDSVQDSLAPELGYSSHSFNQYVTNIGMNVYRLDQGDTYPRALTITKCGVGGKVTDVKRLDLMQFGEFDNGSQNDTGASIGGMEAFGDDIIIVGNTVSKDSRDINSQRNLFFAATDKDLNNVTCFEATEYEEGCGLQPRTPQLTKISDTALTIMYEEYNTATEEVTTKCGVLCETESGETGSGEFDIDARLSDCQPIVCKDGKVRWYVSDGGSVKLYSLEIDADALAAGGGSSELMPGDINNDGFVDAADASEALVEYSAMSTTKEHYLSAAQIMAADVNGDGMIDATDATTILSYYAYASTEDPSKIKSLTEWLRDNS